MKFINQSLRIGMERRIGMEKLSNIKGDGHTRTMQKIKPKYKKIIITIHKQTR